jgi:cell division protease FtsH
LFEGADWQVYETQGGGRALVVHNDLCARWQDAGLIDEGTFDAFQFGDRPLRAISCAPSQTLLPVSEAKSPDNKAEALSFALALKATRDIDPESALQDALVCREDHALAADLQHQLQNRRRCRARLLADGWRQHSSHAFRRLRQSMSWLGAGHLKDVVQAAGFEVAEIIPLERKPDETPAEKTEVAPC